MFKKMKVITDATQVDRKKWSEFVNTHPQGNIFQTPEMYDVYKNTKNYEPVFVSIINDNRIEAILLAVIQKENYGLLSFFTTRSIIFGGPLFDFKKSSLLDILLKEYIKLIEKKVVYSQIRNLILQNNIQKELFSKYGYRYENHLNILIDLTSSVSDLWKGVKRNRKDGINKAKKQGFEFKVINKLANLNEFYILLKELFRNIKLPYPDISFFQNLNNLLHDHIHWFIMEFKGKTCISLCALNFNGVLYAFFIGISQDKDFQKLRPVDLFYWEVIRWGAENGMKYFDWMGAGKPEKDYGVRDFKLQYGGELINFGRYEKIHKSSLFNMAKIGLNIWQKIK
jgi:serine/alanine adding enzyme